MPATASKAAICAITIDLDDTLWPIAPTIMRAERLAHEWLSERAPEVAGAWSVERLRALRLQLMETRADLCHDLLTIRRLALESAFRESSTSADHSAPVIAAALDVFMDARNQVDLYPEVMASLERLSRRYPIVALTNGNANLTRMGLDHLFRGTVSAHAHRISKPHAALFHIACRTLDCAPEEVVHLGDDVVLDVRGARDAGLHAVWMNRDNLPWPGDDPPHTVQHLGAFEQWLQNP